MVGSEPYLSSTPLCFLFFVFCFVLDHGGEAIRSVSGAYPAPDPVVVDWIKLASFVAVKGDTGGYTRLVWLWCLGLAWLELQVFWEFFPHAVPIATVLIFLGRRFRRKGGWILRVITEPNGYLSRVWYQRSYISNKRGQEHCTRCGLGQRGALVLW